MSRQYVRPLILLLATAALVASVSSLYVHYQMLRDPLYSSFCDISETVSCQTVYASEYGTLFGVPVAAGGVIWAGLVLLLGMFGMQGSRSEQTRSTLGYIFLLSLVGMAAVVYFGYTSFVVLGVICPLCVAVYVSVAGLAVVSGTANPLSPGAVLSRVGNDVKALQRDSVGSTLAVLFVAASLALVLLFPRDQIGTATAQTGSTVGTVSALTETLTDEQLSEFRLWIEAQPREDVPVPPEAVGAKVVITKFNDYICPSCRQTYVEYLPVVQKYLASHPGEVVFVTRDFPLEAECNLGSVHLSACEAAAAVRMAKARGMGEAMEGWLFANQATASPDRIKSALAEIAGVTDFDEQYATVLVDVRADAMLGQRLNIQSTPTFFFNGIRVAGGVRPAYLDALIQYELERASTGEPVAALIDESLGAESTQPVAE